MLFEVSSGRYLRGRESLYGLQHPPSPSLPRLSEIPLFVRLTTAPVSRLIRENVGSCVFLCSLSGQETDGVKSLALRPQIVSQAPQHFTPSEKQLLSHCDGCMLSPPAHLLGNLPLLRHVQRSTATHKSSKKQAPNTKGSNERLFILTRTQYAHFRGNHLYQATKPHLKTDKRLKTTKNKKEKQNKLILFLVEFLSLVQCLED